MASVYVGTHKIGRPQAIKILNAEAARSEAMRARFEQEARAANRLHHPGAVEIFDIDVAEDGAPFLVMELVDGETLGARARRVGTIQPSDLYRTIDELLDVLATAHEIGIVHRDIKPENLVIQPDGSLKVLDFGIARLRLDASAFKTETGVTLGTIGYMAPEQARGGEVDGRTDIYAVGATMYRLISGRRLYEAASDAELLFKTVTERVAPLKMVAPNVSEDVAAVVDHALALAPADRYADARAMQGDIRALRENRPPPIANIREPKTSIERFAPMSDAPSTNPRSRPETKAPSEFASTTPQVKATTSTVPPRMPPEIGSISMSAGKVALRWSLIVLGVLVTLASASALAWEIYKATRRTDHPVEWVTVPGLAAIAILCFVIAPNGNSSRRDEALRAILHYAHEHGGEATLAELAAETSVPIRVAKPLLNDLIRQRMCSVIEGPNAVAIYKFAGLVPRSQPPAKP